ncbi:hypothetical protein EW026_g5211 [Hermanssonia centrifuga]|uniref:Uncharacterized protein n=1 Tax=Hermanssonia centrifuga TaxID=98765 RepID=A0A4S4KF67_9APHY|nr:hypothetical protein EW026_g5211 [Hermanssonia centrifuga]
MVLFKLWLNSSNTNTASSDAPPQRVFSELYNSDAMNEEYERIKAVPRADGCKLETVIASIMLWSDSTHLAQFGNASLWPIYAFFGNQSNITSKYINNVLSPRSWVPTRNAFSVKLSQFGFNFFSMLVVDLLHEFELGVWKAIFTHLMRVLYAAGGDKIQSLNTRYRLVPTFGRGTIRRFVKNTSAMKKLAARDWEDMLQVALPIFEGLLDEPYNTVVLDLLFTLATWHALAKLRMHTDGTLSIFEATTANLGTLLRRFAAKSNRFHKDVTDWLSSNKNDPALKNFVPHLKDHLLARLAGDEYDGDEREYTDAERRALIFVDNRIYQHKVIRINYTTYDLRRAQDSLNPRTHADVMVASQEDQGARNSHPYWYARIVGIFHAYVQHVGSSSKSEEPRRLDFLWVRWFGRDLTTPDELAFGFLDPDLICRGVHIIPAFAHGKTSELLGPSIVRSVSDNDEDWVFYYVNIFADRDMFMRYLGGGVGHRVVQSMLDSVASVVTAEEEQGEQVAEARESEVQRLNVPEDEQVLTEGVSDDEEEATDEIGDEVPDDAEYDYGYDGAGPNDEDGGDEDVGNGASSMALMTM